MRIKPKNAFNINNRVQSFPHHNELSIDVIVIMNIIEHTSFEMHKGAFHIDDEHSHTHIHAPTDEFETKRFSRFRCETRLNVFHGKAKRQLIGISLLPVGRK